MNAQQPLQNISYTQELRSEKVRNIIGPMPPRLIRYGIAIICLAMVMVVCVSAFLPFRKVARGMIYISEVAISTRDTVCVKAQLRFTSSGSVENTEGCKIICNRADNEIKGIISTYIPGRTERGEYKVELRFNKKDIAPFEKTEVDFKIILSETSVLKRLLESFKVKNG